MLFSTLLTPLSEEDRDFVLKIYTECGDYMYKTAMDILHNHHDAEDAVNDAMIKIIKHLSKFEGNTPEEIRNKTVICIRAITKNKAIDIYNANKKRRSHESTAPYSDYTDSEDFSASAEDESRSVESLVISNEAVETVRSELRNLPKSLQDAINLVYFCGFSGEEAADFLNISHNALRVRLFEARKRLKSALADKGFID